jgi:hypothetical protein
MAELSISISKTCMGKMRIIRGVRTMAFNTIIGPSCKIILNIKTQNQLSIRDCGNSSLGTPFNNVSDWLYQRILTLTLQIKLFLYVTVISSTAGNSIHIKPSLW